MKAFQKVFLIGAALGLLAATGCKQPLDLSMQRNRIFLLGRLLADTDCDVRVIWRKASEDTAPFTVTADLSEIGGNAAQELAASENGTWQWSGQVSPDTPGERLITITAVDSQEQTKEVRKKFRVFNTDKAIAIAIPTGGFNNYSSLALLADGTLVAWNLSDGSRMETPAGLADVTAIAVGQMHSLALKADGTVAAWGCDNTSYYIADYGQCDVPEGLTDIVAIAAGGTGSLALRADGVVVRWGCEDLYGVGQCAVPAGLTDVVAIAAGGGSLYAAVKADGTLQIWPGDYTMSDVVAVSLGNYILALKPDGTIAQTTDSPALPLRLSTVRATAISSNIALQEDGSVVVWAYRKVFHRLKNIIAVAAGSFNIFLALAEDGSVTAWNEPWTTPVVQELPVPEELK